MDGGRKKSVCKAELRKHRLPEIVIANSGVSTVVMAAQVQGSSGVGGNAAQASNRFAVDLFRILAEKEGSNMFFSPLSISTALAMTFLGARGSTADQMSQVLHFDTLHEPLPHQSFGELGDLIHRANAPYILKVANGLFGQKNYAFLDSFVEAAKKFYGVCVETLDFADDGEGSRCFINSWVEKQTENRIKNLLASGTINALTRLVLINAIYFKGDWDAKFSLQATRNETFHVSAAKDVSIPMMHQKGKFNFSHDESAMCSILELPYAKKELSMFVILPDNVDGLPEVQKELTHENMTRWVEDACLRGPISVIVSLPKFTLQQEFVMNDVLKRMGMIDPFDAGKADFSGMTAGKDLFISQVIHKAFLDVNEEGSEAAAATAVVMMLRSARPRNVEFRADHPFLLFIRDNQSGVILFIGQLCNPSA